MRVPNFPLFVLAGGLPLTALLLVPHQPQQAGPVRKLVLVIHGGEADLPEELMKDLEAKNPVTRERVKEYKEVLKESLTKGYALLEKGRSGVEAVEAAVRVLEDSPLFNAGKGAVFTHDGHNELDASIMEGKEKRAGAVAGVTHVKNPISAARAVMERSPHVMLVGAGAESFVLSEPIQKAYGIRRVSNAYFWTQQRWDELRKEMREEERRSRGEKGAAAPRPHRHLGTVGAVALDRDGNLAAGTSTGGMTNKWSGRVGDSPVIGAGTYADNAACAVSCTGWGEYFIRNAVAHDLAARVKYGRQTVRDAAEAVINGELMKIKTDGGDGVEGGAIVLAPDGSFHITFNEAAKQMSRGHITSEDRQPHVAVLEPLAKK
jgi:beta-aspartyl-peptidase (threonine type)